MVMVLLDGMDVLGIRVVRFVSFDESSCIVEHQYGNSIHKICILTDDDKCHTNLVIAKCWLKHGTENYSKITISIPDTIGFEPMDGKTINVFQVRRNRPLCHVSYISCIWDGGSRTHSVKDASFTAKCRTVLRHPMKVF